MTDVLAAWNVREEDFPVNGDLCDQIKGLLKYAVLAPSGPNTQPWKLAIDGNEVSVIADFDRALPNVDPSTGLFISATAAFWLISSWQRNTSALDMMFHAFLMALQARGPRL